MSFLFSNSITAQTFGIRGGITLASQEADYQGATLSLDSRLGFQGGIMLESALSEDFYLDIGVLFMQGGYSADGLIFGGGGEEADFIVNHIDIPITLVYKGKVGDDANLFGEAGPYVGYAFSAKSKTDDDEMDFDLDEAGYNQFDFGINIGAGVEFSQFRLGIHYMLGLANLADTEDSGFDDDPSIHNRIFGIYATYML